MTIAPLRLYGSVAAIALIAATGGFLVAKSVGSGPIATTGPTVADDAQSPAKDSGLVISSAAIRSAGIVVSEVSPGGLGAEVLASATVTAPPQGQAILTARAAGAVTRIFKRLGDQVQVGDTLATIESREAAQIAADRRSAAARAVLAQKMLAREQSLYQQRVSPRVDLEQAEAEAAVAAAEARRAEVAAGAAGVTADGRGVVVRSPIAGQVTGISATLGAFVQPETELFRVADPQRTQVEAAVASADAARIRAGDRAVLELPGGSTVPARVRAITSALGLETRAATAILEPIGGSLRLGQTLRARIYPTLSHSSDAIVVPEETVQSVGGRDVVFVRTAIGFLPTSVTTGARSAGRIEITSGLKPGSRIATTNAFVLKAELAKSSGEEE